MRQRKISFLVLTAFSSMGGIEKFNRAFMKALVELQQPMNFTAFFAGMYDDHSDTTYVPPGSFQAFSGKRIRFVIQNVLQLLRVDELIIGHLNLAVIGVLYKLIRPSKKLTVICHGMEVFEPVSGLKKKLLQKADHILAVSSFTKNKLVEVQQLPAEKISIFPNTLDPHFQLPADFSKPAFLKERYGIKEKEKVIFTLTRLNSEEGYKGYDKVISILPQLIKNGLSFKYILAGKADEAEKKRMQELITANGLQEYVLMPGFIADEEVTAHYLLADVFVMPSKGEGFGIVFLEAMACGLPVIAGNKDGSVDALKKGELGTLIDPDDMSEIEEAITCHFTEQKNKIVLQNAMLQEYGFDHYKKRVQNILSLQYIA
jgi:glycosyltransferase involved in cell wall biosynthesis